MSEDTGVVPSVPSNRGKRYTSAQKAEVVAFLRTLEVDGRLGRGAFKEAEAVYGVPYMTAKAAYKKARQD